MAKRKLTDEQVNAANRIDATAEFLVRIYCGLQAVTPRGCYWDDLDQILDQNIKDDAEARRVVDALMEYGMDVPVREGHDAWDAAEEVAVRIIGNRDLRYATNDDEYGVVIENVGNDEGAVLSAICELSGISQQESRDLIESVTDDTKIPANREELSRVAACAWARKLGAAGATVSIV